MSSSEEEEFEGESSDDVPVSTLRSDATPNKRRRSQVNYNEEDDDDDDDDIPLSALASPSPKKKTTPSKRAEKPKASKKPPAKASKKPPAKASDSSTSCPPPVKPTNNAPNFKSASDALYGSECDKGLLIQRLLCRWWYAIEWPDRASIPDEPPEHCDSLDGFVGVFVCTEGDEVGTIKDLRDKDACPNFNNMAKKSAEELQALLVKALTEQKRQLLETEGKGTETEKELENLIKWTKKVNTKTADKKALAVLKAAKVSLD